MTFGDKNKQLAVERLVSDVGIDRDVAVSGVLKIEDGRVEEPWDMLGPELVLQSMLAKYFMFEDFVLYRSESSKPVFESGSRTVEYIDEIHLDVDKYPVFLGVPDPMVTHGDYEQTEIHGKAVRMLARTISDYGYMCMYDFETVYVYLPSGSDRIRQLRVHTVLDEDEIDDYVKSVLCSE